MIASRHSELDLPTGQAKGKTVNTALETRAATPHINTEDSYRLVFFSASGSDVFLRKYEGRWSLPEVQIPKFSRVFAEIGDRIHKSWGINCSLLLSTPTLFAEARTFYAAVEVPEDCEQLHGLTKRSPSEAFGLLDDRKDAAFLKSCIAQLLDTEAPSDRRPFTQLGWIYKVQDWVRRVLGAAQLVSFAQLSGSNDTCIIRFATTHRTLWYKAVGLSDPKEFSITCALSEWLPQYLPRILAFDPNLNAWLMESGGEATLGDYVGFDAWVSAARGLAEMQIGSISRAQCLLKEGAADVRARALETLIPPFFEVMSSLMEQQVKQSPAPLSLQELNDLSGVLRNALVELAGLGVPDVIGHSDFNPGNILLDGDRSVFIDWSSAHVGAPTLTLEYLIAHLKKSHGFACLEEEQLLRKKFRDQWSYIIPESAWSRLLELSPVVAVFASAISDGAWSDQARIVLPGISGYLRSLVRIMNREAKLLAKRRSLA